MAAPLGNNNAGKAKVIYDALRKAVVQDDRHRLALGIEAILDDFAAGDKDARVFVRDTLDGKPAQSLAVTGEDGGPVAFEVIKRIIVDPKS